MRYIPVANCDECPYNKYIDFGFGGVECNRCYKTGSDIHEKLIGADGVLPDCPLKQIKKVKKVK